PSRNDPEERWTMLRSVATGLMAAGMSLALLGVASAQQVHRNSFEGPETAWVKGQSDATFRETAHRITDETSHSGVHSETIQFEAQPGTYIYYTYVTPQAPLREELNISLRLKANRKGMQLLARVVLPHERNPNNLEEPLTFLLPGDSYKGDRP